MRPFVALVFALLLSSAHAQQAPSQPGLFEAIGNLLKPAPEPAAAQDAAPETAPTAADSVVTRALPAGAARRVALVIGNAAYPGVAALKNPANDASDIAGKLKRLGFDVIVRTDMRHKDMLRTLTEFGDKVQPGAEALFFYAGHGMQVRGKNYLVPIDEIGRLVGGWLKAGRGEAAT